MSKDVVLSFSGGLDTSFCIPYLQEQGYAVHTVFANTGGVSTEERAYIEQRAVELGAASHVTIDLAQDLFESFVTPFVWSGEKYQNQYPLLVSDRYLIVQHTLARCAELGTRTVAHGCTGMGNDQVRFDVSIQSLGDYEILAPIREIQKAHTHVRQYEQDYLEQRGFAVPAKQKAYTINENVLGITLSGGEIDQWQAPGPELKGWCAKRAEWPGEALEVRIGFRKQLLESFLNICRAQPRRKRGVFNQVFCLKLIQFDTRMALARANHEVEPYLSGVKHGLGSGPLNPNNQ